MWKYDVYFRNLWISSYTGDLIQGVLRWKVQTWFSIFIYLGMWNNSFNIEICLKEFYNL